MKTISDGYVKLNQELHNRNAKYGAKGHDWADRVEGYLRGSGALSWLDYGAGKGTLADEVARRMPNLAIQKWDPATFPGVAKPADFLTSCDVLEHCEPEYLDNVLADIKSKMRVQGLLVISQRLANKKLADGRNAHLIVKPTEWWMPRLQKHFSEVIEVDPIKPARVGIELAVLVRP